MNSFNVIALLFIFFTTAVSAQNQLKKREPLTHTIFLQQVKDYHPLLELAYLRQETASAQRLEKQGAFDPLINAASGYRRYNSSADLGRVQKVVESRFSVDFLSRYGIRVRTGVNLAIGDIKTPVYPTGEIGKYFIDLRLPLLRGAGINPEAADESKAFLYEAQTKHLLRQTELRLLPDALNYYWQWVGAKKKQEVEQLLLKIAQFRAKAIQQKIAKGLLATINGTEAQREVKKRSGRVYKAERALQQAAFKLASFLWKKNLEPALTPTPEQAPDTIAKPVKLNHQTLEQGKQRALHTRPEIQILNLAKKMAEIDHQLAQNTLQPQIDLFVTPGYQVGKGAIEGGTEIMTGISMTLPVFQRTARGQIKQTHLAIKNLNIQKQQIIRTIMLEIMDKFSAVNMTYERYQMAKQELELAQQLENGEKTRFEYGDSTLFLVNRRERATGKARLELINVFVEYHQAVAGFKAATGEL